MTTLDIQFKDFILKEIEDTDTEYSVFQGTFSEDGMESRIDVSLLLGGAHDGMAVHLESNNVPYGSPIGIVSLGEFMNFMLTTVAHGHAPTTSLYDIIKKLSEKSRSGFILKVTEGTKVLYVDEVVPDHRRWEYGIQGAEYVPFERTVTAVLNKFILAKDDEDCPRSHL